MMSRSCKNKSMYGFSLMAFRSTWVTCLRQLPTWVARSVIVNVRDITITSLSVLSVRPAGLFYRGRHGETLVEKDLSLVNDIADNAHLLSSFSPPLSCQRLLTSR